MPTSKTSQACSNTRILGKQRTAENFERLVALMLLAFQALPSLWRQMHPPFRLQAVEGSLPSEAKYGRDEKSCCLHIWCSINRTSHNVPLFQLLGIRDFGICLLLSPASLGTRYWNQPYKFYQNFLTEIVEALGQLDNCDMFLRPSKSVNKSLVSTVGRSVWCQLFLISDANLISLMTPSMFAKKFMCKSPGPQSHQSGVYSRTLESVALRDHNI